MSNTVPDGRVTEVVLPIIDRLGQRRKPVPSIRLVLIWIFIFCVIQIQRWQWRDFSVHVLGLIVCETLQLLSSTVTEIPQSERAHIKIISYYNSIFVKYINETTRIPSTLPRVKDSSS